MPVNLLMKVVHTEVDLLRIINTLMGKGIVSSCQ